MITNEIIADINDYEPISQGEYKRLKRDDPVHYHEYTARIRFNYFKKKQVFPIVFENKYGFQVEITDNGLSIYEYPQYLFIGKPDGERFKLLKQAIQKCEEVWK